MTAALGDILLPYQQRWIDDRAPVKVIEKSRRIGLTWGESSHDALVAASAPSAGGMDVWYVGYNADMAREFIQEVARWATAYQYAASAMHEEVIHDEGKDILAFRVDFASGFSVTALSSRPSNLRGKQGLIVIDEAAFHPDLKELLKAALAFLVWGGRVHILSTHDGEDNPFNELCEDIRKGRKPYSLHRVTFDEAVADGLYRAVCRKLGTPWSPEAEAAWVKDIRDFYGEDGEEELDCIPRRSGGAYLPHALIERAMRRDIPVVRWECKDDFAELPKASREAETAEWCERELGPLLAGLDKGLQHFFGEDFGRKGDLSVIWPLALERNLSRRTPFTVELRNVPFEQQRQVLFYIVDRLPRFGGGALDARGNGAYLAEVAAQQYGAARIAQVQLSQEWYRENMPRYKAAYEDETLTIPQDADVLADHRALKMEKGVAKVPDAERQRGSDRKQRHGDSAIAGALAWFATESPSAPIEFTEVPKRGRPDGDGDDDAKGEERLDFDAGGW